MAIYAEDLSICDPNDLEEVLENFGKKAPEEYKPLWPAVGTILEMVEALQKSRRPDPTIATGKRWMDYLEAVRREREGQAAPDDALEKILRKDNPEYSALQEAK